MKIRLVGTWALITALCFSSIARSAPPTARHSERLAGSVQSVDPRTGTIRLLTGVGYALRVRRVQLSPRTRILARGAVVDLSRVTPGCIVRTACRTMDAVPRADTLEILAPAPSGRMP